MKKLILFLSILFIGFGAMAQNVVTFTADTLTDADNTSLTSYKVNADNSYSLQVVAVEITGAATLQGLLQFSNDNTNWTTLATADTLALTDDGSIIWEGTTKALYLRAYVTQTGEATSSIAGTLVLKK